MGWGLSLHMQLNPKKFFAPSARTIIASLRSRPLTSLRSARAPGSLRSPKRVRYAHTTKPHHLANARAYHSLRSQQCNSQDIGVDRHTRKLCMSARKPRLRTHVVKLHMPTTPLLSKHTPHISGALDPHSVRRTPVPYRTHYVRAHGPNTTGGLPRVPLGGYIHYLVCMVSLFYALVGLVFCVGWLGGFV